MKRKQGSHLKTVRIVSLYRDDLDEIIAVLSANASQVVISDDKYEYDSLAELEEKKGTTLKSITITSSRPYLSLDLKRRARLYCGTDPNTDTLFLQLKDVMQSRNSVLSQILDPWVWLGAATALAILASLTTGLNQALYLIGFMLIEAAWLVSYMTDFNPFFSINLSKRHAVATFWSRNKDKIIVGLILGVVGALVGAILTKVLG